jgi:hypothetical protein
LYINQFSERYKIVTSGVGASGMTVSRSVHVIFYPCHFQNVQALRPNDYFVREIFCNCLFRNQEQCMKFLSTDEAIFSRACITNTRNTNTHVCS